MKHKLAFNAGSDNSTVLAQMIFFIGNSKHERVNAIMLRKMSDHCWLPAYHACKINTYSKDNKAVCSSSIMQHAVSAIDPNPTPPH